MMRFFIGLFFTLPVSGQTWQQSIDFPAAERDDAVSFTIGNFAYCGSGVVPGWLSAGDFYKFDLTTQEWSSITALPSGQERQYACAFVHGSKGYVFGGYDGSFINSFLEYDPVSNQWTQLPAMPSLGRGGSSCFVVADTAYIVGGRTASQATDEVWAYHINEQTWVQKNNLPFGERWKGSAISHQNNGYFGFGRKDDGQLYSDFYRYDAANDDWIILADLPSDERCYSQFSIFDNKIVTLFGLGNANTYLNDVWIYDDIVDVWTPQTTFPNEALKGGIVFSNHHSIYYSTGITSLNERQKRTWKLTMNDLSVGEFEKLTVYPNPVSDFLTIPLCERINLFDAEGKLLLEIENTTIIDVSKFPNGIYLLQCEENHPIKIVVSH